MILIRELNNPKRVLMGVWIKHTILKIKLFEIGISTALYFVLIFFLKPLLYSLGISLKYAFGGLEDGLDYKAIFYLLLGLASMMLGYYLPFAKKFVYKLPKALTSEWDYKKIPFVFISLFFIDIGLKLVKILSGTYFHLTVTSWLMQSSLFSLFGLFNWLGYAALIIAFVAYYNLMKRGDIQYKNWRIAAWGTLIFQILYAVPTCTRLAIISPLIIYLIVRSYLYGPIYRQLLIILPIVYLMVLPLGNMCRNVNTINNFVDKDTKVIGFLGVNEFVANSVVSRSDQFNVFSKLIKTQNEFLYGENLEKFFISLGPPRFIWKNKPTITLDYNAFGKRIGILSEDDKHTSVGPTLIGDWYMNFGVFGIVFGMMFMGFLWRVIYLYLRERTNFIYSGILIYAIAWLHIVKGLEDSFAPVYAGLVKIVIILCIIHFFLRRNKVHTNF